MSGYNIIVVVVVAFVVVVVVVIIVVRAVQLWPLTHGTIKERCTIFLLRPLTT